MNQKGAIPVLVLWALGLLAATQLVPNWRVSALFAKPPPTKQLNQAEAALAKAQAQAKQAEDKLASINAQVEAEKAQKLSYAQEMTAGAVSALDKAPVSPEVTLARSLSQRAALGLESVIGGLPADKQKEIEDIVTGALSQKQAEVDAAKAALAEKDKELQLAIATQTTLQAEIPQLTTQAKTAEAKAEAAQAVVTAKTNEVAAYADKAAAKEKEAGSLGAVLTKAAWLGGVFLFVIFFCNFILPSLAAEFPGVAWLVKLNQTTKSLTSAHP